MRGIYLVVGASGFIGNHLYNYFSNEAIDVRGTYYSRTFKGCDINGIKLDFKEPNFSRILGLKNLTHIFFCHGVSDIDQCKTNHNSAYKINVTNTISLLEKFAHTNVVPVYLSTDMVYNGSKKDFTESDASAPTTEYGKQKVEVENYITKHFSKYIILRLSKVYGVKMGDKTLFTSWLESLMRRETILSATDSLLSPIFVRDVVYALDSLVNGEHYGIFNLGGLETATRYELSQRLAEYFKQDLALIEKKSINDFNFIEPRPMHSSLNFSRVIEATKMKLTSVEDCFKLIEKNYRIGH